MVSCQRAFSWHPISQLYHIDGCQLKARWHDRAVRSSNAYGVSLEARAKQSRLLRSPSEGTSTEEFSSCHSRAGGNLLLH
jgi:hypothetical protein